MYGSQRKRKIAYALGLTVMMTACGPRLKMTKAEDQAQQADQQPTPRPNPEPIAQKPDGKGGGNVVKPDDTKPKGIDLSALPFKMAKIRGDEPVQGFKPYALDSGLALGDAAKIADEDRKFIRYLTTRFHEQMAYSNDQERAKAKINMIDSVSVLLNSLSNEPAITKPVALDGGMSVFRIDIRRYGWTVEQFEAVVKGTNFTPPRPYPYGMANDDNIVALKAQLGTEVPLVRADWFLFEAGRPENYHVLLGIEQTLADLEKRVKIDRLANIKGTMNLPDSAPLAIRAAIGRGRSGVSTNNRVIERHAAATGNFWLSYDFAAPEEGTFRDIFVSPLGPSATGNVGDLKGFEPAGGEVIFSLPNGLQAYALLNEANARIDIAPTAVVFNPTDRLRAGAITNGYACWSCHSQGILSAKDELRPYINETLSAEERNTLFGDAAVKAVNALHPEQGKLDALYVADSKTHNEAVVKARLVGTTPMAQMAAVAQYYEQDMSLGMVAAELDLSLSQFNTLLRKLPKELQSALHAAKNNDMDRGTFEGLYPKLIDALFVEKSSE